MNLKPSILICSSDDEAIRRISASIEDGAKVVRATSWSEVEDRMLVYEPAAAIVDVRCDDVYRRMDEWSARYPDVPVIAMGRPRSDRILIAEKLDVFATADPEDDYRDWQKVIRLAVKHHHVKSEVSELKAQPPAAHNVVAAPPAPRESPSIIAHVAGAFRHFEHVDLMLDRAVEGLAAAAHATRVGLFTRDDATSRYRLHTGQRYLRETAEAEYEAQDPLVRWFERHAHMVTRNMAGQLQDPAQKKLLLRNLDLCGAEIMAPLHARGRLLGWFFIGHRSTGHAYDLRDLEEISMAADYLSMLLENALLYREVAVQKSLAETLLHSLPTGIVAVDGAGIVRWFSTSAEKMLERKSSDVVGQGIEFLGSRLADMVRRTLNGNVPVVPRAWEEPASRRYLQVDVKRLGGEGDKLGAVLLIMDLSSVRQFQEKQEQLERTAFWTDLAAGLSHEIRNPLVTIRTFAQLLPERYADEDFRDEFSTLVAREVDRLSGIIDQINNFAHPPDPVRSRIDVRHPLQQALKQVFKPDAIKSVSIKSKLDGNLPLVQGDERALIDCFAHLFQNAAEALDGRKDAEISYSAITQNGPGNEPLVQITIHDNGRGIPEEAKEKLFSPFYTTKARGMGLGLPIVKRTVIDHNGRVNIDSNGHGTNVIIQLPVAEPQAAGGAA